jgi:hypothetical protein
VNPDVLDLLRALSAAEARFLVRNKRALGRPRDLAELELLGEI